MMVAPPRIYEESDRQTIDPYRSVEAGVAHFMSYKEQFVNTHRVAVCVSQTRRPTLCVPHVGSCSISRF